MSLMPKRTRFRKQQKGQHAGLSKAGNFVEFGDFGMQVLDRGWITAQQIEASRVAINRYFKRRGKVWIRIFPDKPVTKKPAETRMGKGKGALDHWVAVVRPGRVLFEVGNVSEEEAKQALARAAAKLGIKTRFVKRVEKVRYRIMMRASELLQESDEELSFKLGELRREIFELYGQKLDAKSQKTHVIGQKKKEIARILTVLRAKELKRAQ